MASPILAPPIRFPSCRLSDQTAVETVGAFTPEHVRARHCAKGQDMLETKRRDVRMLSVYFRVDMILILIKDLRAQQEAIIKSIFNQSNQSLCVTLTRLQSLFGCLI